MDHVTTPWTKYAQENEKLKMNINTLHLIIQDYKTLLYDIENTIKLHKQAHPHMDGCNTLFKKEG